MVLRAGRGQIFTTLFTLSGFVASIITVVPQSLLAAEPLIEFDIPAQPLDAALSAYGALTRTQLVFDPGLTEGLRSNRLKGSFAAQTALRQLLAGTGIAARMIDDEGFTLVPELATGSSHDWNDVSPTVRRFNAYSGAVQSAIRNALCGDQATAPGSYRVLARVWVGPSGTTIHAELLTSTGDARRDAMLAASFRGLAIGAPPPSGLPQPVTLLVTSEDVSAGYCPEPQRQGNRHEAAQ